MNSHGFPHPEFLPSQAELSREAERRYALATATRAVQQRDRGRRPAPLRRARHALAIRLVATARLIDAT